MLTKTVDVDKDEQLEDGDKDEQVDPGETN
jgi:hypothetical protein